jgi:hypothetical protein
VVAVADQAVQQVAVALQGVPPLAAAAGKVGLQAVGKAVVVAQLAFYRADPAVPASAKPFRAAMARC